MGKTRRRSWIMLSATLAVVAFLLVVTTPATSQSRGSVSGVVTNSTGHPVPGVAVSLVHQSNGRSAASTTNQSGQFTITNVAPSPMPYYLEVYWGRQLIYRQEVRVDGPVILNVKVR